MEKVEEAPELQAKFKVEPPWIYLQCPPEHGSRVYRVNEYCFFNKKRNAFKIPFSGRTLIGIAREFGSKNTTVTSGQEYIDALKKEMKDIDYGRQNFSKIEKFEPKKEDFNCNFKLEPHKHQLDGLYYLRCFRGGALFADCGCLSGDSIVKFSRGGKSFKCFLEDAFLRFNGFSDNSQHNWDKTIDTKVRSLKEDGIRLHTIREIKKSGVKVVYKITLSCGKTIKATVEHEFYSEKGWKSLSDLEVGEKLAIDTLTRHQKKKHKRKPSRNPDQRMAVGGFHPYARWQKCRNSGSYLMEIHRVIYEASINNLSLEEFVERTKQGNIEGMTFIDPKIFHIHHKDHNHYNNDFENLECMEKTAHAKEHARGYENFDHGEVSFSPIVSIEKVGEEMTYDIVCDDPYRNFVSNGIVVHNSGKTGITLWDINEKIREGKIKKSSVLVASKLMTLYSGWQEDASLFAGLSADVLWEKSKTKIEKNDQEIVCDHGEKPKGKGKKYERTEYYFKNSGKEAVLASPRNFDERRHVRKVREWKQVGDTKYGEETLSTVNKRNLRAEAIGRKIRSDEYDIHVINHEGLVIFQEELAKKGYEYIVIDESTAIKNSKSKVFKSLKKIARNAKYTRILSATPSPQGPEDLWSQFYFLDGGVTLSPNYKEFLYHYFNMVDIGDKDRGTYVGTKPVIRKHGSGGKVGTLEAIDQSLKNRVFRCRLRDCIDLPPITYKVLDVHLTDELIKHYEQMEESLYVELEDKEIDVTTDLAKIGKLRQICSGFIIDTKSEKKDVLRISKTNPKFDTFQDWLSEIPEDEKIIIFSSFKEEVKMLLNHFGESAVDIYGDTQADKKLENQQRFVNDPSVRFLIANPQSAAYGVNKLTVARYMMFYSYDYKSDFIYQGIKRIERQGQEKPMFVFFMKTASTVEEDVYRQVMRKEDIQQRTIDSHIIQRFLERGRERYGTKG